MNPDYLDFEQPIAVIEAKINELRYVGDADSVHIAEEIGALEQKLLKQTETIFSKLNAWQISQLARHPSRPYTQDYIENLMTDFHELHGDRAYADDAAIIGGIARYHDKPVMVIGHQKGRDVKERVRRNYGMPRPEGYRKALRLMRLAEQFNMPVITFIDTAGAYPGVGAEERGQSEAIAKNLQVMSGLGVPIIAIVVGEGGSGGALALGVGDHTMMLQYSTYSVISPEGCATILWKSSDKASTAAEALGITSQTLLELELVDEVVPEPLGGSHRNPEELFKTLDKSIHNALYRLVTMDIEAVKEKRYQRLMSYGRFEG